MSRFASRSRVLLAPRIAYLSDLKELSSAAGAAAVARGRAHLDRHGWVHLPGFVERDVVERMVGECRRLDRSGAPFLSRESHTPYQEAPDPAFPPDHPRNQRQESSKLIIDYAKVPRASPLRELYQRDDLRRFVRGVVRSYLPAAEDSCSVSSGEDEGERRELFLSACPYNAAYYNIYRPGHGLGWHFDRSAFGVNLVLKTASQVPGGGGGVFEWSEHTRTSPTAAGRGGGGGAGGGGARGGEAEGDPWAFDRVREILSGNGSSSSGGGAAAELTRVDDLEPGSLVIFAGIASLHRVTPVTATPEAVAEAERAAAAAGSPDEVSEVRETLLDAAAAARVERINAILTYETQPGQRMNAYGLKKFFGRDLAAAEG